MLPAFLVHGWVGSLSTPQWAESWFPGTPQGCGMDRFGTGDFPESVILRTPAYQGTGLSWGEGMFRVVGPGAIRGR